ncbi:MAG: hypothetical protein JOY87_07765 [Candidatus Eremiobacteraeota bacterium]|nr:hypothetical protein [Candidatus Eremiobacteraeota bacterium]
MAERAIQVTDFACALTMRALIGTPRKALLMDAEEATDLVLQPLPSDRLSEERGRKAQPVLAPVMRIVLLAIRILKSAGCASPTPFHS